MDIIGDKIKDKVTEYCKDIPDLEGAIIPSLLIDFVIEKYKARRNYPSSFKDDAKLKDMEDHLSTLAMAVIDLYSKTGAEGQTASTEQNISRTYENAYISSSVFKDVFPFVDAL